MDRSLSTCPECKGTGCDPEPLKAPADGSAFLFPRCAVCNGKGKISDKELSRYRRKPPRE